MHGSSIRIQVLNPRRQSDAVQIKSGGLPPLEMESARGSEKSSSGSRFSFKIFCETITSCLQKKKRDHSIILNEIE
jgi:hypothetical protein